MEVAVFALVPVLAVLAAVTWVVWQVLRGVRWALLRLFGGLRLLGARVIRFAGTEVVEAVQLVGGVLTAAVLLPLTAVNMVIGRWRTGRHYGRAFEDEVVSALLGVYRIGLAHPLRFIGLGRVLEGIEKRVPEVVHRAPREAGPAGAMEFPGYDVVGTLPPGGSGAQLFLARPQKETFERVREAGGELPGEVVIKSFALVQGSTLPQIVRESRALEAAKRLGLVFEHHLAEDRFYYVMRYVRGDDLDQVVQRMHARSGDEGLGERELGHALAYTQDILKSLDRFHQGGLWHKDVKPANLIVSGDRVHLVDFGLVTPLQSALTLTTHGTEYYRDPEMVRLAMQGVKVHEVDGVKFDLYSAGAVLFSMIENSFPAHGSLSQLSKRCPEALAWIIRRAMANVDSRYRSAWEMLDDVQAVAAASDPHALRPADLPSVQRGDGEEPVRPIAPAPEALAAEADTGVDPSPYALEPERPWRRRRRRPRSVRVGLLAAGIAVFALIAHERRMERERAASMVRHAVAMESPRLYGSEQDAYELGKAALEAVSIDDQVSRWTETWERLLADRLPRFADTDSAARAHAVPSGGGVALVGMPPASNGRVLVLEDHGDDVDRMTIAALERALVGGGFEIAGQDPATEARDVHLFAGARHAVGLGTLEDVETHARLQSFLNAEPALDAIVWVGGGDEPEKPQYRVLVRRDSVSEPPLRFE